MGHPFIKYRKYIYEEGAGLQSTNHAGVGYSKAGELNPIG
jgi:hypothetical protein